MHMHRFLNTIKPGAIKRYNDPVRLPIHANENVTKYLKAVRKYIGVDEYQMFSTVDLTEAKNIYSVASHLHSLGRTLQKKVADEGFPWKKDWPTLGVKETKKNVRTFTKEQLQRAAAQPSIMNMGSSKMGRSQAENVLTGKAGSDLPREAQGQSSHVTSKSKNLASGGGQAAPLDAKAAAKEAWKAKMAAKKSTDAVVANQGDSHTLPAGWETLYTDDGTPYFFNGTSGETQWEAPSGDSTSLPEGWSELKTDDGTPYYMNAATGVTQWEAPSGDSTSLPEGWSELKTDDGTPYYMNAATGVTQWEAPEESATLSDGWATLYTDDGTPYYFNSTSDLTQWERP
jgi:hypothetical protein